jgi:hypothetical protein
MPAAVLAALQLLPLITDIIGSWGHGASQEDLDKKWTDMQKRLKAANDAWEASKS